MDKKFNISDTIAAVTYKGCVTIEYFDIVKGKKTINAYNEGTNNLFDSLAKALRKDTFTIPDSIMLYKGNSDADNVLNSPIPYTVTPLLYRATYNESAKRYLYENITGNDLANCVGYAFIVPKGSFTNVSSDTKVTRLTLVNSTNNTTFATLTLEGDKQFVADNNSNIQILWKLIFK